MTWPLILVMAKFLSQNLKESYFKGISLYAKRSSFKNHLRFYDSNQTNKYSHNFLYLTEKHIHDGLISIYITLTKSFGFSQFVTFSKHHQDLLVSYVQKHQPILEEFILMIAPIKTLIKRIQINHLNLTIDSFHSGNEAAILNFNYDLDVEYGEICAKGNRQRMINIIYHNPLDVGFLMAKSQDRVLYQLGYYYLRFTDDIMNNQRICHRLLKLVT